MIHQRNNVGPAPAIATICGIPLDALDGGSVSEWSSPAGPIDCQDCLAIMFAAGVPLFPLADCEDKHLNLLSPESWIIPMPIEQVEAMRDSEGRYMVHAAVPLSPDYKPRSFLVCRSEP